MNPILCNQILNIITKTINDKKYKKLQFDRKDRHFWTNEKLLINELYPNIILKYIIPIDCIFVINSFLNWMPGGCYKDINLCIYCYSPRYLNICDIEECKRTSISNYICSWNCLEKECRNRIMISEDFYFKELINSI